MSSALLPLPILLALLPGDAAARDLVHLRTGLHATHSRLVFDWPRPTGYSAEAQENRLRLTFDGSADFDLAALRRPLRNLVRVSAEGDQATIEAAAGTRLVHFRVGDRVVVDLIDPAPVPGAGTIRLAAAAPAGGLVEQSAAAAAVAPTAPPAQLAAAEAPSQPAVDVPAPAPVRLASAAPAGGLLHQAVAPAAASPAIPVQARGEDLAPRQLPPRSLAAREPSSWSRPEQNRLAQGAPAVTPPVATPAAPATLPAPTPVEVRLQAGTGRLLGLASPAATVMAADPRIARVQPSSPTSVFLMAVANGRTTVIATDELGRPVAEFDVTVVGGHTESPLGGPLAAVAPAGPPQPRPINAAAVQSQIRALLGGPGQVRVRVAGNSVFLTGTVATPADARRAESIVRGMANENTEIVNELAVLSSIQVNLRVRVAEISRDITRQFGLNWSAIGSAGNFAFGLATGGVSWPITSALNQTQFLQRGLASAASGGVLGSPQRFGAGYRAGSTDINGIIDALAADNLVSILAEPNLTAQSGEVASFLAGGEFPIPVAARDSGITIEFKPYGVSLAFVPIVLSGDRLTLRVRPEVSELSDNGAVNLPTAVGTLRIPALSVRRAETTVELGSGQSFAIAGLLQRNTTQAQEGVNGLTDLPVLGALFRSERFQRAESELVIIVTPYLVRPVSDPTALRAPTDGFVPATSLERILRQRQVRDGGSSVPSLPAALGFRLD